MKNVSINDYSNNPEVHENYEYQVVIIISGTKPDEVVKRLEEITNTALTYKRPMQGVILNGLTSSEIHRISWPIKKD